MRHLLLIGLLLLIGVLKTNPLSAQDRGVAASFSAAETPSAIPWKDSVTHALAEQRRSDRPIVVFVDADFCGFCRKMHRETWADPAVVDAVRKNFVPLHLTAERDAEAVRRLGVSGFPTTIIYSRDRKPVDVIEGFVGPKRLLESLAPRAPLEAE